MWIIQNPVWDIKNIIKNMVLTTIQLKSIWKQMHAGIVSAHIGTARSVENFTNTAK